MNPEDIYIIVGVTLTLVLIAGAWFYFHTKHEKLKEMVAKNSTGGSGIPGGPAMVGSPKKRKTSKKSKK